MMKKIVLFTLLLFIFAEFYSTESCQKELFAGNIKRVAYTTARSGLRIRKRPNLSADQVGLVPYGKKVEVLREIGERVTITGRTGRWTKIRWLTMTGWVFGGYLSKRKPYQANPYSY